MAENLAADSSTQEHEKYHHLAFQHKRKSEYGMKYGTVPSQSFFFCRDTQGETKFIFFELIFEGEYLLGAGQPCMYIYIYFVEGGPPEEGLFVF